MAEVFTRRHYNDDFKREAIGSFMKVINQLPLLLHQLGSIKATFTNGNKYISMSSRKNRMLLKMRI